ncbi:MAG: divalent-cation tolerance protein CutA [Planctomycetia bacterium]|nr:divalent-cation tolerance protein CutA [Planctomycetia bacterium]
MKGHFWSRFSGNFSNPSRQNLLNGKGSGFIQLQITVPDWESGEKLAAILVENRWCACAQILGPIQSHFFWKEKRESENEFLILAKTRDSLFEQIADLIAKNHPYECPQIIALPIMRVSDSYKQWLDEQIRTVRDQCGSES